MKLSKRENDVMEALIQGKKNDDIADQLNISVNTVKTHLRRIYGKLEAENRVQAIFKYNQKQNNEK